MDNSVDRISAHAATLMEQILYELKRVVDGKDHFLERVMVAVLAQGHLLVEGVPGLAKTLTVKTLAATLRGTFKRIQFTPDLVPADLVGTRIFNPRTGEFSTSLGPVFTHLLLADEINRAPAKVQSALLEVMQERQVTIAGEQKVAEHRPERSGELAGLLVVDAGAHQVGGHQVGRELDPLELAAHGVGQRLHGERLGQARHAFDQQVALRQHGDHHAFQEPVLPDDDALDLVQDLFHQLRRGAVGAGSGVGHAGA
jgi:hypothetical protein